MRRQRAGWTTALLIALLSGAPGPSPCAHEAGFTRAEIAPLDGGRLRVTLAVDARLVPVGTRPDDWAGALVVRFDGRAAPLAVEIATPAGDAASEEIDIGFVASVPPGTAHLTLEASALFGPLVIRIAGTGDERRFVAAPGRESDPLPLTGALAAGSRRTLARFVALGYRHILPDGLDHVLFVLGLCLAGSGWRSLLAQVTAFTVAHSATLALCMAGVVTLPGRIVEPLIAVSIVWVAVENLLHAARQRWRMALVFAFGLLHGLGFAGALTSAGLGQDQFLLSLLGFNLGVELGQLTVIAAALAVSAPFARRAWFRPWLVRPASAAIALAGAWWAVERTLA